MSNSAIGLFKATVSGLRQFLTIESPLKVMKNAFNFTLKALFILKIFKSCLEFLIMYGIIKMIRLISKFMTSQPGKQMTVMFILPNMSNSKDNQTMKLFQLIEIDMRNIFLKKKTFTKCGGETIPRPFSQKSKLSRSVDK